MDSTTVTNIGGKVIWVEGLAGRILEKPTPIQPSGKDIYQWIPRAIALQVDGIPIRFTPYRPADLTGRFAIWREFSNNVGDIDTAPVGIPMGPRHFKIRPGANKANNFL